MFSAGIVSLALPAQTVAEAVDRRHSNPGRRTWIRDLEVDCIVGRSGQLVQCIQAAHYCVSADGRT